MAGCVKTIQVNLGATEVAGPLASCAEIHDATKTRILFFYPSTVGFSQEEENCQLERFHSTLNHLQLISRVITVAALSSISG